LGETTNACKSSLNVSARLCEEDDSNPSKPNTEQLHDPFDDPENMECMEISDDEFEMMHDRQYLGYCLSDKDIGALRGPLNSVVIGAMTPGCCRLARQASAASADDP